MKFDYKRYFPFPKVREQQDEAIKFAFDAFFNQKKRFVIIEMGTGGGKSPLAVTLARYFKHKVKPADSYEKGSWFLTTQKILQNQYVKDFGPPKGEMASVKSASNYQCDYFTKNRCSDSLHLLKQADPDSRFFKACSFNCKYKVAKKNFIASSQSITNFPYFLTETSYVGKIKPRQLLIIDECHTIEEELSKFIEITISEKFSIGILDLHMPDKIDDQKKSFQWIKNKYSPTLDEKINAITKELKELQDLGQEESDEAKKITSHKDKLENHQNKIQKFLSLYNKENWVYNLIPAWNKSGRKMEFKPIDVGQYSNEYLFRFGEKILLLSATVLNKEAYCESIGIDPKQAAFISIDSPFPKENTPVFYFPVGDMSKAGIDSTLPEMANIVKALLEEHKNEKGIIHTRTFKIANYLMEHIKDSRLLIHNSDDREDILNKHCKSKKPTVLVSPSSTEGLDLKDDLSRFQIVCKIHWPYLGDELVKRRINKYTYWYSYQAVKHLIQARGRSIRTEDDYAVTYILDDAFEQLYAKNIRMFPKYFRKSLHME
jgi:Rad3-related DNA helicase